MAAIPVAPRVGPGARLQIQPGELAERFDREPFGFAHNLHTLDLLQFDCLLDLARKFADYPREYFVAAAASSAATQFQAVQHGHLPVHEALRSLDSAAVRVLLKRPENQDVRYRELLNRLFDQVVELRGGLRGERVVRLESAIFVTSASSITPCHFDPEIAFFAQIQGRKHYHVFAPASMSEVELEGFYRHSVVSIAQVDLQSRDPKFERVFHLEPGEGHHQPQNSPHWVETGAERSISYSFVFETDVSRARNRTRACNYFLRRGGLAPALPGTHPLRDAAKAAAMRAVLPIRRRVGNVTASFRRT
jgi:cupin-like protein